MPAGHQRELNQANEIIRRTCLLLTGAHDRGMHITIENPADRSEPSSPLFVHGNHGSLWRTSWVSQLLRHASARTVTFALCSLGGRHQKYTTLAYSTSLHVVLGPLAAQQCSHPPGTHQLRAGGREPDGSWASRGASAYPPGFNRILAEALVTPRPSLPTPAPAEADADTPTPPPAAVPGPGPRPGGGSFNLRPRELAAVAALHLPAIDAALATRPAHTPFVLITSEMDDTAIPLPTPKQAFKTYAQAMKQDASNWTPAVHKEINAVTRNGTLIRIDSSAIPHGRRILNLLWVFKVKRDGTFKARLCVQGSRQQPGVDYDQSWAGTMRAQSLRALAAIAAGRRLRLTRWDLTSAYLQGELQPDEHVYTYPPPGSPTTDAAGNKVYYKVAKPLYGLVQAGRRFQRTLFPWLETFGFVPTAVDPCVFVYTDTDTTETIYVGTYVDDLCVAHTPDGMAFQNFHRAFFARWEAEDEGEMRDLLNTHLRRDSDGSITLHTKSPTSTT